MKRKLLLLFALTALGCATLSAQARKGLKINEVMVVNDSNAVDEYGRHAAWIELFNSNYAAMEISSVFLTNDTTCKTLYPVPLGDVKTKIPKRQHVVFWADGQPSKGTFHMNFTLREGQDNWIGVYDADGKTLIDEVTVPASLAPNTTYARSEDGTGEWEVRDGSGARHVTPSSANVIRDTNSKVEMFAERDENGFGMTVMAMCIVFSALLLLSVCFYVISKIGEHYSKGNKAKSHGAKLQELTREERPDSDSGEAIAAIALALHEHLDAHDRENTVLTINKVRKAYSPWNSKIYNMRQAPRH